jgi:hypothetical protein
MDLGASSGKLKRLSTGRSATAGSGAGGQSLLIGAGIGLAVVRRT